MGDGTQDEDFIAARDALVAFWRRGFEARAFGLTGDAFAAATLGALGRRLAEWAREFEGALRAMEREADRLPSREPRPDLRAPDRSEPRLHPARETAQEPGPVPAQTHLEECAAMLRPSLRLAARGVPWADAAQSLLEFIEAATLTAPEPLPLETAG